MPVRLPAKAPYPTERGRPTRTFEPLFFPVTPSPRPTAIMNQTRTAALLLAATVLTFGTARSADPDWKLRPLAYNNPGLEVDLGVGLWAWPMPMDYDGDGDMDLLVACPDKPSNGVYLFENPSQDPDLKSPVFKPGVRVGKAGHNMQVSYVDGQPRIL